MTPPVRMKIRLVQCPRCRKLLAELPDISVYRCGGCDTILQAKSQTMKANPTMNFVARIHRDSFPEEEESRSSNLFDFPSPPKEESSPDKDNIGFQDEGVESSSELSEYRSAYDGLCSSPEFNRETGECSSLQKDFEIYDNKLHDSDEDSTGGGNFSGEISSSTKASENIYFDRTTKVDQPNGERSPRVWQGEEKLMDKVQKFYGHGDQESRLHHVDTEHREGLDDNYSHLEHDIVSENEATRSNQDFTNPPKEESSSDKDSRNVSNGPLGMPDIDHCQYEDSPVEESVNHDKVKCCLDVDSKRYVRELHESDGEWAAGGNFSGDFPNSRELVYEEIDELATEAKRAGKDVKIYFDQPTNRDQCDNVEFSAHEDQENGWPLASAGIRKYYVNLENNDISQEEARSSSHGLGCQHKEEFDFSLDKDNVRYHEERLESSSELSEHRSISNGLLSSPGVKVCENKDMIESLKHDDSEDLERSDSGLLDPDEDEDSFLDGPEKVDRFEGGESLGVCQKNDNVVYKVKNISEHEAQENGLSTVSTEHREGITNNNVHLENDDGSKEVTRINEHGEWINDNHVHLGDDDVAKEMARSLSHDLTSAPKEDLSLDKASIHFQDEHVESRMEYSGSRIVSNDFPSSPQINCCQNEDPLMEEYVNKDQGTDSLAPDLRWHDSEMHGLDGESTGGGNVSSEIRSSTELVNHETEEIIPESVEHAKERNKSYFDQPTKLQPSVGEKSLLVFPEADRILHEVHSFSGHEGTSNVGVGSAAAEIVSHEDDYASPVDDGCKSNPTFKWGSTNNRSVDDTIVASQVISVGLPAKLTCLDCKHVDRSPRKGSRNFTSASSVELFGDSLFSQTSPEHRVKPIDAAGSVTIRGYYASDSTESSRDETDGQIPVYVPHSSRRKGKEVNYSSITPKKEGFVTRNILSNEPEMMHWPPNPDVFTETKSHIVNRGNTRRSNEGGSSRLPFISRNLQVNQRLRSPSAYRNNLPPLHPGFHSPDKMDLLRTVAELKDQLNRIQLPQISRDIRFPAGVKWEKYSPSPFYSDHLVPGKDRYMDLNHHGNYQWYDQQKGRVEQSNVSALALSGEAAHYRNQVNCSCLHCRTRDWHSSAPLLQHFSHYNGRSVPRGISSPSSPRDYTSYEFSGRGHESMLVNQRLIYNEMRRFYARDKYNSSKKHLRSIAGGSPFVTCYHCAETLQLPADFLSFRKRYHQLRCNACSKVLKFSLVEGKHIVPYVPHGLK